MPQNVLVIIRFTDEKTSKISYVYLLTYLLIAYLLRSSLFNRHGSFKFFAITIKSQLHLMLPNYN